MLPQLHRFPPALRRFLVFFFFNDTATTEIYTLSLHDALPICFGCITRDCYDDALAERARERRAAVPGTLAPSDRKSTRLNSSHLVISYAVFCLKKKKNTVDGMFVLILLWHWFAVRGCETGHTF